MLYIIDKYNFKGCIEAAMPDEVRTKYTGLTLKEFRDSKNNPNLITITVEEFELLRDKYKKSLITSLKEITEGDFYAVFKEQKIYTGMLERGFACFFFGESHGWNIYNCYCDVNGRYYMATKKASISRYELEQEAKDLYRKDNPLKKVIILEYNYASENIELYEYLEKQYIKDISELFDQDTCKIRIRGYDYPFIKIKTDNKVFIVYSDVEYDVERKELETILFLFFSDDYAEHFEKKYSCGVIIQKAVSLLKNGDKAHSLSGNIKEISHNKNYNIMKKKYKNIEKVA